MRKILAILLTVVLVFSVTVVAYAVDLGGGSSETEWDKILLGGFERGDVDANGKITAYDARLALQHSVGNEELTGAKLERADKNNDGNVTAYDARLILTASVENS